MGPVEQPAPQRGMEREFAPDDPALRDILPDPGGRHNRIHIGVDVGQVRDPSAYVVAEVAERATGRTVPLRTGADPRRVREIRDERGFLQSYVELVVETVYLVHAMKRLDLGTRYPEMATEIARIVCSPKLASRPREVRIDQTGVGRPIAELISDAITARDDRGAVWIRPITFTSGRDYDPRTGHMAKAYLVSRLQALSQANPSRIILAAGHPEAPAMFRELKDYSLRVSQDGHDEYGALKIGQWDDLATALGLAVLDSPDDDETGRAIPFTAFGWSS
jgi:hypothetical protein